MKSYIVLGIGIITFLLGIFFFWLSREGVVSPQNISYQPFAGASSTQSKLNQSPSGTMVNNSLSSTSTPSTTPVVAILPNQTSTSWADAQVLIRECQIESVNEVSSVGGSFPFWLSSSAGILGAEIQAVSSTCGTIPVTNRTFTYDIP